MSDSAPKPTPPTVTSILTDFLERLTSEEIVDGAVQERLSKALSEQKLDPKSLRDALFGKAKSS